MRIVNCDFAAAARTVTAPPAITACTVPAHTALAKLGKGPHLVDLLHGLHSLLHLQPIVLQRPVAPPLHLKGHILQDHNAEGVPKCITPTT